MEISYQYARGYGHAVRGLTEDPPVMWGGMDTESHKKELDEYKAGYEDGEYSTLEFGFVD